MDTNRALLHDAAMKPRHRIAVLLTLLVLIAFALSQLSFGPKIIARNFDSHSGENGTVEQMKQWHEETVKNAQELNAQTGLAVLSLAFLAYGFLVYGWEKKPQLEQPRQEGERFSRKMQEALEKAGWFEGRSVPDEIKEFNFELHGPARNFIQEFGDLWFEKGGVPIRQPAILNMRKWPLLLRRQGWRIVFPSSVPPIGAIR